MSDFDFSSGKRFSPLTLGRAERVNARFLEVATAIATKLDKSGGSLTGDLTVTGNFSMSGTLTIAGGGSFGGALNMGGNKITNVANGLDAQDVVTRGQLTATAFSTALPSQSGNAGKFVTTDGTNAGWTVISYATIRPFSLQTAGFSASAGYRYRCETGSGAITSTLPASPSDGSTITIRRKGTNTVTAARNGKTIAGAASDLVIDTDKTEVDLKYNATTGDWEVEARVYA